MAVGSEKFSWQLFGDARRICWQCGKEPLRIKDVGEHRRPYPGAKDEFLCVDCQQANIRARVEARKARKGS